MIRGEGSSRESDQLLTADVVVQLVREQFPDLAGQPVQPFGAGWDNELFAVGSDWLLRFPRRGERVQWLIREVAVSKIVAAALGDLVPRLELRGAPSARYPYPFAGYRRLPGVAVDRRVGRSDGLAGEVGHALARLHRIDVGHLPAAPSAASTDWASLQASLRDRAPRATELLGDELRARAGPYLLGLEACPERYGPRCVIHNDICPDHLLVDPNDGRLCGLIDLGDATVGDPVVDFVGLIGVGGFGFIASVLDAYDLPLGVGFAQALTWRCRTLTLSWLIDAADADPVHVPKHLGWVTYAFEDLPERLRRAG